MNIQEEVKQIVADSLNSILVHWIVIWKSFDMEGYDSMQKRDDII